MKHQATHDLGLDVHQATIVATSRNESGAIVLKATVPTEAKAIVGLVRGQGPRVHVAFEEGTQAQWLHDLLQPIAERVIVCNVRGKKELVNKNDEIDSDLLSERLRRISTSKPSLMVFTLKIVEGANSYLSKRIK